MWSRAGNLVPTVLESLADRQQTLATAESLTGGMLAGGITDVPGASRSFVGGVVSYATRVKVSVLDVPADVVDRHGVVSEECAIAMARGVRRRLDATWGVATTGVAGPDGQEGHPVGTVWIAVAGPEVVRARLLSLTGDRHAIREATCESAVSLLRDLLREEPRLR
ncbi:CinA family protein [Nocardioides KLBMP 9356]|uniref:CinA family protein n=1 Tax=Nocardioides potassii TaxID=2911371 RepID=A0ABS9HGH1_9ACTN|nr:CinA family protein [Nocardioides potassii]MCF6379354.1 CinA family protein [Nocardioides potassii]